MVRLQVAGFNEMVVGPGFGTQQVDSIFGLSGTPSNTICSVFAFDMSVNELFPLTYKLKTQVVSIFLSKLSLLCRRKKNLVTPRNNLVTRYPRLRTPGV